MWKLSKGISFSRLYMSSGYFTLQSSWWRWRVPKSIHSKQEEEESLKNNQEGAAIWYHCDDAEPISVDSRCCLRGAMISVSYILLCGQFLLLFAAILLQCLEGIHSQNSSTAASTAAPAASPTQGASSPPSSELPETTKHETPAENNTEPYEYRPPSPVVLCSHLWVTQKLT